MSDESTAVVDVKPAAEVSGGSAPDVSSYLFSMDSQAPRRRRGADALLFFVSAAVFILLGVAAQNQPPLDARVVEALTGMPGWIRTFAWIAYSGSAVAAFGLLVATVVRGGPVRVTAGTVDPPQGSAGAGAPRNRPWVPVRRRDDQGRAERTCRDGRHRLVLRSYLGWTCQLSC